ncbi:unnamed protein product, partial [Closterium sp. NIES-53]
MLFTTLLCSPLPFCARLPRLPLLPLLPRLPSSPPPLLRSSAPPHPPRAPDPVQPSLCPAGLFTVAQMVSRVGVIGVTLMVLPSPSLFPGSLPSPSLFPGSLPSPSLFPPALPHPLPHVPLFARRSLHSGADGELSGGDRSHAHGHTVFPTFP